MTKDKRNKVPSLWLMTSKEKKATCTGTHNTQSHLQPYAIKCDIYLTLYKMKICEGKSSNLKMCEYVENVHQFKLFCHFKHLLRMQSHLCDELNDLLCNWSTKVVAPRFKIKNLNKYYTMDWLPNNIIIILIDMSPQSPVPSTSIVSMISFHLCHYSVSFVSSVSRIFEFVYFLSIRKKRETTIELFGALARAWYFR